MSWPLIFLQVERRRGICAILCRNAAHNAGERQRCFVYVAGWVKFMRVFLLLRSIKEQRAQVEKSRTMTHAVIWFGIFLPRANPQFWTFKFAVYRELPFSVVYQPRVASRSFSPFVIACNFEKRSGSVCRLRIFDIIRHIARRSDNAHVHLEPRIAHSYSRGVQPTNKLPAAN